MTMSYARDLTDEYVEADAGVPELARFKGMVGRVVSMNRNGKALVDFGDGPWYDLEPEHLNVVSKPAETKKSHGKE